MSHWIWKTKNLGIKIQDEFHIVSFMSIFIFNVEPNDIECKEEWNYAY